MISVLHIITWSYLETMKQFQLLHTCTAKFNSKYINFSGRRDHRPHLDQNEDQQEPLEAERCWEEWYWCLHLSRSQWLWISQCAGGTDCYRLVQIVWYCYYILLSTGFNEELNFVVDIFFLTSANRVYNTNLLLLVFVYCWLLSESQNLAV